MDMIYVLVFLALLQVVFTQLEVTPDAGLVTTEKDTVRYIYGGETVVSNRVFPHVAAIGYKVGPRREKIWACGGTLLNTRFVLTAAHCLDFKDFGRDGKPVLVRLGDLDLKNASDNAYAQQINVLKRIPHPGYSYPMHYNDIGLIKLRKDAVFDNFVKPACLHKSSHILTTQAEVVGWGRTEKGEEAIGQKLNKVTVDILPIDKCQEIVNRLGAYLTNKYLNESLKEESMICAGVLKGEKDSCHGDSGGPLQVNSTIPECRADVIGIVSFGLRGCGNVNTPAVYVRVAHYVPWIEDTINKN